MVDRSQTEGRWRDGSAPSGPGGGLDPAFDRIVELTADLFDAPFALLVISDGGGTRVSGQVGFGSEAATAAGLVLTRPAEPWVVEDAAFDMRLRRHPLVAGAPGIRFLAGAPLLSADGEMLGTLCALDRVARPSPSSRDMGRLDILAALAVDVLDRGGRGRAAVADAEAVAAARSDLLADLSHEMRTPLSGIVGFTSLLKRDGSLAPDTLRTVERIEEAGRGLLGMVGDALDLSKLESGAVRLDVRPFAPERLVEEAVALLRPDAERKGLRFVVDLPDPPAGLLLGDPDKLRQVLLNLLSNAVKFTVVGVIRVSLSFRHDAGPDGPVPLSIAVEDSGVGIATDDVPRLFRRFTQADDTASRGFGGTGLGLAISKRLVDAMDGIIAVESAPGVGSRFSVSLALRRAVEPRPRSPSAHGVRDGLEGSAILVVEDVPVNQRLVVQMLAPLGAEVDVVGDGVAALAAVGTRDYALVLMDMEMPVLGGLEATRRIRAMGGAFAGLPIVALTANVFPEQLALCREAGMDHHLTKPFTAADLTATALRWARRPARADGRAR